MIKSTQAAGSEAPLEKAEPKSPKSSTFFEKNIGKTIFKVPSVFPRNPQQPFLAAEPPACWWLCCHWMWCSRWWSGCWWKSRFYELSWLWPQLHQLQWVPNIFEAVATKNSDKNGTLAQLLVHPEGVEHQEDGSFKLLRWPWWPTVTARQLLLWNPEPSQSVRSWPNHPRLAYHTMDDKKWLFNSENNLGKDVIYPDFYSSIFFNSSEWWQPGLRFPGRHTGFTSGSSSDKTFSCTTRDVPSTDASHATFWMGNGQVLWGKWVNIWWISTPKLLG